MNLSRKIEIAKSSLDSITTHRDEDSTLRKASLDAVIAHANAGKAQIDAEASADVTALAEA